MVDIKRQRFHGMRARAKRDGKYIPTIEELKALAAATEANGMKCPKCQCLMNWRQQDGASTVVSLQHDRDGTLRFICFACNIRHSHCPGDSFYQMPPDHRWCGRCQTVKPATEFYKMAGPYYKGRTYYAGHCKACRLVTSRAYNRRNQAYLTAKAKERRQRKREAARQGATP